MVMFSLNPQEIQNGYQQAAMQPFDTARDAGPGFFEGSGGALISGLQTGGMQIGLLAHDIGAAESGEETDQELANRQAIQNSIDSYRAKPETTGWLGNVLHGVASIVPPAVVGTLTGGPFVGAGLAGATSGHARTDELLSQNVDPNTSKKLGVMEGLMSAGGLLLPVSIPGRLATRVASGAAINASVGAAQRGITGKVLADNGYKDMATQYKIMDSAAIFSDMILGGAFGAFGHGKKGEVEPLPSEMDAALAANNIHQLEIESAPGIPADVETRNAHVDAMDTSMAQLMRGEEVNVSEAMGDPNFVPKPANPEIATGWHEAFAEEGLAEVQRESALLVKEEAAAAKPAPVEVTTAAAMPEEISPSPELVQSLADLRSGSIKKIAPPETLTQFVARSGGLKDEGGDVASMGGAEWHKGKPFQKKLVRENGAPMDDMALKAWEHGYFPELQERPAVNQFLDALEGDMKGHALRQRPEDIAAFEAKNGDTAHLSNLAQELDKAGIDYAKLTDAQVAKEMHRVAQEEAQLLAGFHINDIMAKTPDMPVPHGDGMLSIKDAWAKSNEDIARAQKESGMFDAAVSCFLRFGDEE